MRRSSLSSIVLVTSLVALAVLVSGATLASRTLHLDLRTSEPLDGDTLVTSPTQVRLVFTEAVDPATSTITLRIDDGTTLDLTPLGDSRNAAVLLATIPAAIPGNNRVTWRVLSVDGHAVAGRISFYVTPTVIDSAATAQVVPAVDDPVVDRFPTIAALLRGTASAAQLALAGMLFFLLRAGPSPKRSAVTLKLALFAVVATFGHVVGWLAYTGVGGGWEGWLRVLGGIGQLESLRLLLLAATAVVVAAKLSTPLALMGAAGALLIGAGIGHAASFAPLWSIPAKAVHLGAAAIWLGGLLTIIADERTDESFRQTTAVVSSAALGAVIAVAVSGLLQAFLIAPPGALLGSRYGLTLSAKTVGLAGLVGFGAYHRFRLLPAWKPGQADKRLRESVGQEVLVFVIVVLVAGVLGYMSPPG